MEPTTAAAASGAGMNGIFLIMIVFLGVFMFLSSRSQKKRENEHKQVIKNLVKDTKVVLLGGIVGTVVGFNGEIIEIKVSESVKLSVLPSGIVTVLGDIKANTANGAK